METKEQLINTIKKWVKIDNELRTLQKEQSIRKAEKKKVSNDLIEVMRKNEIDCFDIKDGQILYNKKNVKKPLTKKMLQTLLADYFNGDILKASELNNYIMDNREDVVRETITRVIDKEDL